MVYSLTFHHLLPATLLSGQRVWRTRKISTQTTRLFRKGLFPSGTRTYRRWHLSPLQNHILGNPSIGVHIDPFVFIAHQKLHSIRVGEDDDCVGFDAALDLEKRNKAQARMFVAPSIPAKGLNKNVLGNALVQIPGDKHNTG